MSWREVHEQYRARGLALGLGAGVSMGSGLPSWGQLLQRLALASAGVDPDLVNLVSEAGLSLPAAAAYLQTTYPDRRAFVEAVRGQLYRAFPFFPQGYPKGDSRLLTRYVDITNATLRSVAAMCVCRSAAGTPATPNPRLKAVVTFNLDNLLESYVASKFGVDLMEAIERPAANRLLGRVPVFHAHGMLRFDLTGVDTSDGTGDAAVLTEQDYFDFFNDPTGFFTYTFLHLLREHSFLFLGLSMNDDNLRRLLHYSHSERLKSLRDNNGTEERPRTLLRHFSVHRRPRSESLQAAMETTLAALGTQILWVADYDEVPGKLGGLYRKAGDSWSRVF